MINFASAKSFIAGRLSLALITGLMGLLAASASASTPTDGETPLGLQPGAPAGSYALSDLDHINLYNGNLNFTLPLMHIGGRGGAQMTMNLTPLELKWRVLQIYIPPINGDPAYYSYILLPPGVWNPIQPGYGPGVLLGRRAATDGECGTGFSPAIRYTLTRLTFIAPDGTEYELRDQSTQGKPADLGTAVCFGGGSNFGRGKVFVTADGSAMTFLSDAAIADHITYGEAFNPTGYLFLRDGARFRVEAGLIKSLTDRNGNVLSFTYDQYNRVTVITDSINRTVNVAYGDLVNGGFDSLTWRGSTGTPRTLKVWGGALTGNFRVGTAQGSSTYTQKTYNQLFPDIPNTGNDLFDWAVISAVELPDGRRYRFYYNSYAELARVELPTGGAYEYDRTPTDGVLNSPNTGYNVYRRVTERRSYADGLTLENKTTYTVDASSGNTSVDVNQRDGSGNLLAHSKHYFWDSAEHSFDLKAVCYPTFLAGKEYLTEAYDLGGNLLRKQEMNFAQRAAVSWWSTWTGPSGGGEPPNDTRLTDSTNTLGDVTPNLVSRQEYSYDQFNNRKNTWEYDFGQGTYGTLIRHTRTNYVVINDVNSTDYTTYDLGTPTNSIHIRSLPRDQSVYAVNSSGVDIQPPAAQTTYEYDKYDSSTGHAALVDRSAISGHDSGFNTARQTRGNATAISRWLDTSSTWVTINQQYDIAGNVVKAIDPRSTSTNIIATTFDFSDAYGYPDSNAEGNELPLPTELPSSVHTYAFATRVTNALNQNAFTQYDYYLGRAVNSEDANGIVSQIRYDNDLLDRPSGVDVGIFTGSQLQHHTSFVYNDTSHLITSQSDQTTLNDGVLRSTIVYDGLGRTTETRTSAPEGTIYGSQEYDAMGRVKRTYNPYQTMSDSTYGYADTSYDGLGRVLSVTTSDGAVVTMSYSANATTVTDQAGKKRRSITDALGRLIRVDEPDSNGNLGTGTPPQPVQSTSYVYDVLDDLTAVTQGSQTRSFSYDSLKRLKQAFNPESGTINYTYDANSNLLTKQDARSITTSYSYDALNRVTKRTYTDSTPEVDYYYDNQALPTNRPPNFAPTNSKGRLIGTCYGGPTASAGNYQGYDQLGRVTSSYQQTDSINYGFGYGYNLASEMTTETYPSGRQVITEYDSAGRAAGIRAAAVYYAGATASDAANRIQYAPQGAVSIMKLGNGKWEHTNFNNRLQPKQIGLGTSGTDSSLLKLDYEYTSSCQTANNGNVLKQTINASGLILTQNYCYDALNRLSSASENSGSNWTQNYDYDRYGNRALNPTSTLIPNPTLTPQSLSNFSTATNRITLTGFAYDAAGNMKNDPTTSPNPPNGMTYDGENRQKSYTRANAVTSYAYDGDGHRVKKVIGSVTTVFVYNAIGELTAEYTNDTTPPVGGGGTSYLTSDHLGSTRLVTGTNQTQPVKARYDYLPFGEEIPSTIGGRGGVAGYGGADSTKQKFTQKERDNESGLDYFGARYYSGAQGRFTSSDPLLSSAEPGDPQTWNRYSYTLNNPLKYVDPLGLYVFSSSVTEDQRKQFRAGIEKAREQLKQFKAGSEEYTKIKRALDVYGDEGVKNGVSVYTGAVPGAAVGGTRVAGVAGAKTADNPTGQDIRITFEAGQYQSSALAADVAHEGSHAADGSEWVASGFASSKNPTTYQTEFKAYTVTALIGQKLFPTSSFYLYSLLKLIPSNPNLKMPFYEYLWNSSWAEADVATLRSQNINHHLGISKKQGGTYGVTESRQGGSAFLRGSRFPR